MTDLSPCLSADELRVYLAAVNLHDDNRFVTLQALHDALGDMTFEQIEECLVTLNDEDLVRTEHRPLARVRIEREAVEAWRREAG